MIIFRCLKSIGLTGLLLGLNVVSATAATPAPGGSCSTSGQIATSANVTGYQNILYCNGTNWLIAPISAGTSVSSTCTAAELGLMHINGTAFEYCDGIKWRQVNNGAGGSTTPTATAPANTNPGYWVLSHNRWDGNLGGISGANEKCVSDLTTYDWMGKTDATARGLVNERKIYAYICTSADGCNSPIPFVRYYYAVANELNVGGAYLEAASTGGVRNTTSIFALGYNYFGASYSYWTGRGGSAGSGGSWGVTATSPTCSDFTSNSAAVYGNHGYASESGNKAVFNNSAVGSQCNIQRYLICMVNP